MVGMWLYQTPREGGHEFRRKWKTLMDVWRPTAVWEEPYVVSLLSGLFVWDEASTTSDPQSQDTGPVVEQNSSEEMFVFGLWNMIRHSCWLVSFLGE